VSYAGVRAEVQIAAGPLDGIFSPSVDLPPYNIKRVKTENARFSGREAERQAFFRRAVARFKKEKPVSLLLSLEKQV
jgi:hypothetical protein